MLIWGTFPSEMCMFFQVSHIFFLISLHKHFETLNSTPVCMWLPAVLSLWRNELATGPSSDKATNENGWIHLNNYVFYVSVCASNPVRSSLQRQQAPERRAWPEWRSECREGAGWCCSRVSSSASPRWRWCLDTAPRSMSTLDWSKSPEPLRDKTLYG